MTSKTSDQKLMLELLANENSRDILCLTSKKECSASQLSNELDIAPATIYRNLKNLELAGMIQVVKTIMDNHGNEEKYFRCSIRRIIIDINGKLDIRSENEDLGNSIIRLWKRIARS